MTIKFPFINFSLSLHELFRKKGKIKKKFYKIYKFSKRTFNLIDDESKDVNLPVNLTSFNQISSKISISGGDNKKWRVGYRFIKDQNHKNEFVFHVFQDSGSNTFHSRIFERVDEKDQNDKWVNDIAIKDSKNFTLVVRKNQSELLFFVDDIPLGKFEVPLEHISKFVLSAWGHGNVTPITIEVDNIRIRAEMPKKGVIKNKQKTKYVSEFKNWYEKWWVKYLIFPTLVGLALLYVAYIFGLNGNKIDRAKSLDVPSVSISPTGNPTLVPTVLPTLKKVFESEHNRQNISAGDSYLDPKSKVIIGISNIGFFKTADISITSPNNETKKYRDVVPGQVFYYQSNGQRYSLIIKEINYTANYISIVIN